jgi:hypothetical protein
VWDEGTQSKRKKKYTVRSYLVEVGLDEHAIEWSLGGVHVFLEVLVQELEDQVQLAVGLDAVQEVHHVVVLQGFQQRDLTECGTWDALVFEFQANSLQCHDLLRLAIARLVHDTVRAFADSIFVNLFVTFHSLLWD